MLVGGLLKFQHTDQNKSVMQYKSHHHSLIVYKIEKKK